MNAGDEPLAFFERAEATFREGAAAGNFERRTYRIAEQPIELVAGPAYDFAATALTHLVSNDAVAPSFRILAWDDASSSKSMPAPPWSTDAYGVRGEIEGFNDDRFRTAYDHGANSLSMIDLERGIALFWMRDAAHAPQPDRATPFRTIFHWWAEANDSLFVHGAAVGSDAGAVLIAGAGGAGKSNTALLSLSEGLFYLGDDYCLVRPDPIPRVFSLYATAKCAAKDFVRFPALESAVAPSTDEPEPKRLLYLAKEFGEQLRDSLPLRAILVPHVTLASDETIAVPTSSADALKALAPSTISQLTGAGAETFHGLAALVRQVPCFRLSLGRDSTKIAGAVRKAIEQANE